MKGETRTDRGRERERVKWEKEYEQNRQGFQLLRFAITIAISPII